MPVSAAVGTIQTGTGTSPVVKSGLGFQPKIVIFFGTRQTAVGQGDHHSLSFGAYAGEFGQGCVAHRTADNRASTTLSTSTTRDDSCIVLFDTSGTTLDGRMGGTSLDSDGFTVTPADAFTQNYLIPYLALGGTSIEQVKVGNFNMNTATGAQQLTGVGFQPDIVIFFHESNTITTTNSVGGNGIGIGVADGTSQYAIYGTCSNNGTASAGNRRCYITNTRCFSIRVTTTGTELTGATFTQMLSNGFEINKEAGTNSTIVSYIAIKCADARAFDITLNTSIGAVQKTGLPSKPAAAMLFATMVQTAFDTSNGDVELAVGAAASPSQRCSIWTGDNNSSDPTESGGSISDVSVLHNRELTAGYAAEGLLDISSFDATGITFDQEDAEPAAYKAFGFSFGPAAGAGAGPDGKIRIIRAP